jgi:hypothetical protein
MNASTNSRTTLSGALLVRAGLLLEGFMTETETGLAGALVTWFRLPPRRPP